MGRRLAAASFVVVILLLVAGAAIQRAPRDRSAWRASTARPIAPAPSLPVMFEPDAAGATVLARANGYAIQVKSGGAALRIADGEDAAPIEVTFTNGGGRVAAERPLPTRISYFGGPREQWRMGTAYAAARISGLYEGVDALFYGSGRNVEYDLIVAPGRRVDQIRLRFSGVDRVELESGALRLQSGRHTLVQHAPVAYQRIDGRRSPVGVRYTVAADGEVGFAVDLYDAGAPLVIDPEISYSTYFGGTGVDGILAVTTDAQRNAYLAGWAEQPDFPLAGSGWKTEYHAFVAKLRADGTAEWLAFLAGSGGNGVDAAAAAAIGPDGDVYVTGTGCGDGFPTTPGAYRTAGVPFTCDGFVARLAPDGTMKYSTLLGAPSAWGPVGAAGIVVDSLGRAVVTGSTASPDFVPTMTDTFGPRRPGLEQPDVFVARVNADGTGLDWSRLLAGSGYDHATAIAMDRFGNYFVVGATNSTDYPLRNPVKAQKVEPADPDGQTGYDGFLTQLWEDGQMGMSTYLGGSGEDSMRTVAVGQFDRVYVGGSTTSPEAATLDHDPGKSNGVIYLIGSARLLATRPVGGSGYSAVSSIAIGPDWTVWVGGDTDGAGFQLNAPDDPLPQPAPAGGIDLFVRMYEPNLTGMWYSYVIGGASTEFSTAIAVDRQGDVYLAGTSTSADYPVRNALQSTPKDAPWRDGILTKLGCYLKAFLPTETQPAAGGEGSIFIYAAPGCVVDAVSDSPWLRVTGSDSGKVYFTTDPNPTPVERTANITLSSKKVAAVTQAAGAGAVTGGTDEIVLNPRDVSGIFGEWRLAPDEVHASILTQPDRGAAKIATALTAPSNYFSFTFTADAGRPYHLWIHGRARNDDWRNDSIHAQFSDSVDASGNPIFRVGTTSATWVSLEECSGCGERGWGWQDNAYGARGDLGEDIYFETSGTHTILLQTREDGFEIGQIVLSAKAYLRTAPGGAIDDPTIVTAAAPPPPPANVDEIVLWPGADARTASGTWRRTADPSAAGETSAWNPDAGAPKLGAPLAAPANYVDVTFTADAGKPYHLWLRMKADNDHWTNDSVWVQFSGSVDPAGTPVNRIGTSSGLWVSLEECSGCGEQGWGWQDNQYGAPGDLGAPISFAESGAQTIRIQTREDGVAIDQIVLSASRYAGAAPGGNRHDTTILPRTPR
jgi:hypothetical protein